jgi:alcohol dehydrogenase class IV
MIQELARVPRVTLGAGSRSRIGRLVAQHGQRALLVIDQALDQAGFGDEVDAALRASGVAVVRFHEFAPDPRLADVDMAVAVAKGFAADSVVAVGGGSALDLGKAVAAIAGGGASAAAYDLCARDFPVPRLRMLCVPTTAGTGAEMTRTAVLTRPDGSKTWLWGDAVKADDVVLDPELTLGLPPALTAATGLDALVHAVEAATNRKASAENTLHAHAAIRLVATSLPRAVAVGSDLVARASMQRAAMLAGMAIDNAGTAIAHAIGHALGSLRPIHHGQAVALAMLATAEWNCRCDDGRWAACAEALGAAGQGFAQSFGDLLRAVGHPTSLGTVCADLDPAELAERMRAPENAPMRAANWRETSDADLLSIARAVLDLR